MKRMRSRGVVCDLCGQGIRLLPKQVYVRCSCANVGLYGRMDSPVIVVVRPNSYKIIDSIMPVEDDYKPTVKSSGGVLVVSRKAKSIFGMPTEVVEKVMPVLAFGHAMGWTEKDLYAACQALINYAKMIDMSVE